MGLFAKKSRESATTVKVPASEWVDKGCALRKEGKCDEALECYEQALELNPRDGKVWRFKAEALAMRFRYEESVQSCEKALEINPSDAEAWFFKSFALEMLGKYEEALESYDCVEAAADAAEMFDEDEFPDDLLGPDDPCCHFSATHTYWDAGWDFHPIGVLPTELLYFEPHDVTAYEPVDCADEGEMD